MTDADRPYGNSAALANEEFIPTLNRKGGEDDRKEWFAAARRTASGSLKRVLTTIAAPVAMPSHVEKFLDAHDAKFGKVFRQAIDRVADDGLTLFVEVRNDGPKVNYDDDGTGVTVIVWGDPNLPDE